MEGRPYQAVNSGDHAFRIAIVLAFAGFNSWAYIEIFSSWQPLIEWLLGHETLSAGFMAVAGALTGAWFLSRQTAQVERHVQEQRFSKRQAARAVLPLALSSISNYAIAAAKATKQLLDQCVDEDLPPRGQLQVPDIPDVPTDAIWGLKEMAEFSYPIEIRSFATLLADIQVQSSRLGATIERAGTEEQMVMKANLEEYIIDCALIYARAGSFFQFARGASEGVPASMTWRAVHSALFHFGMFSDSYDGIRETILRRSGDDLSNSVAVRWTARA